MAIPPTAAGPAWIGRHPALLAALARLRVAGRSGLPVLLRGETGTGKELAARTVHAASAHAGGPFLALNCAALPDGLIESELFGAARGAFTGATDRAGLVEAAAGGTLFLDEIGDAGPALQGKLLRLLDHGEFRRLGETRARQARVRVVAATHRDLEAAAQDGRFRADLWYRLAAIEVVLPPLRERGDDVLLLARAFLAERLPHGRFDDAAVALMRAHAWPGNVRELAQAVAHGAAFARADGVVGRAALPARIVVRAGLVPAVRTDGSLAGETAAMEAARIAQALVESGGNRARAARRLGMSRQGLWRKLKRRAEARPHEPEAAWRKRS